MILTHGFGGIFLFFTVQVWYNKLNYYGEVPAWGDLYAPPGKERRKT